MRIGRFFVNILYTLGAALTLPLCIVAIFGGAEPLNPDAMLPVTMREFAFVWLAVGSIPMTIATGAVLRVNKVSKSKNARLIQTLLVIPAGICAVCALYIVGIIAYGYISNI